MEMIKEIDGQKFVLIPLLEYKDREKRIANNMIRRLSFTELNVAKVLINSSKKGDVLSMTNIAELCSVSLPTVSKLMRVLETTEILESHALGRKGTNIKILNNEFADMLDAI